ncbi:MAG: alpha/beta hydrolase [Cellvibrionaceae bacterium]
MILTKFRFFLLTYVLIALSGCSSYSSFTQLKTVPDPLIYREDELRTRLFPNSTKNLQTKNVLYVTDRTPAKEEDLEKYYKNERSPALRAGLAEILPAIKTGKKISTVNSVEEFGYLAGAMPYGELSSTTDKEFLQLNQADKEFKAAIDNQLRQSTNKDIYIYVHGYKVVFENPLLITHELWRFMSHEGVFLAYAWPSTPNKFAYLKDIETAQLSGQNLRLLIEYLAQNTEVERIHILGYSAGTRVVMTAIQQLALKYDHLDSHEIQEKLKVENVILTASDYDISVFAASIGNGLLNVASRMTIYMSGSDKALGISSWIFRQQRLGQYIKEADSTMNERVKRYLSENERLQFVDATRAESANSGNGHGYFIKSPWVSSDIILSLTQNKAPNERGLVRQKDNIQWEFPENYKDELRTILE